MKKNYIGPKTLNYNKKVEKVLKKKSTATLKGELQQIFNTYIRLRDTKYDKAKPYFICISCNTPKDLDQMHAGHYWPVGGHGSVRYDEINVNGQCFTCNVEKFGNEQAYRVNLINKIGQRGFRALEMRAHRSILLMRNEIEELIIKYTEKVNQLKKC
jgi:hypothetical protein